MATENSSLLGRAFVSLEAEITAQQIAKNWKWILFGGTLDLVMGIFALMSPTAATDIAYSLVVALFYMAGALHILWGWCFVEYGYKSPYVFAGLSQIIIASVLRFYPLTVLTLVTVFIAILFILDGTLRIGLALNNKDMAGYGAMLCNGVCAVLLSIIIISTMPASTLSTIGILLGVNLSTFGLCRMVVGCAGRSIAQQQSNDAEFSAPAGNIA